MLVSRTSSVSFSKIVAVTLPPGNTSTDATRPATILLLTPVNLTKNDVLVLAGPTALSTGQHLTV